MGMLATLQSSKPIFTRRLFGRPELPLLFDYGGGEVEDTYPLDARPRAERTTNGGTLNTPRGFARYRTSRSSATRWS